MKTTSICLICILCLSCFVGACRKPEPRALLRAGQEKDHVRALLLSKQAAKINDLVSLKMDPHEDWWVTAEGTCLHLLYDDKLELRWIVVGAPKRGFKTMRDWRLQNTDRCKQYHLE